MADSPAPYRKFPGRGSGVVNVLTLWEGDTHLLLVNSWPTGESYRRFFFADIQAIILRRTKRRLVFNIILGVLLLPSAAPLVFAMFQDSGDIPALGHCSTSSKTRTSGRKGSRPSRSSSFSRYLRRTRRSSNSERTFSLTASTRRR